ncbi:MAG: hypothetical protein HC812_02525 [Leptolyngbya sp. RL_3_1]|nr:hypothetical protein [Leptolyngbya sp. RL_3_1]
MIHASPPWDLAGGEGLAVAKQLFGEAVNHLAPFQSFETIFEGEPCGVLRLGDRNFRVSYSGPLDAIVASLSRDVWVQQFPWLSAVPLSPRLLTTANIQITTRPPHRWVNLPHNRAVPVQIDGVSILLWNRDRQGQTHLEGHSATSTLNALTRILNQEDYSTI